MATRCSSCSKSGVDEHGKPKSAVQQRFVKLGATRGDQVAVLSGITAGDVVVTGGQMKLRNGAAVVVNNSVRADQRLESDAAERVSAKTP